MSATQKTRKAFEKWASTQALDPQTWDRLYERYKNLSTQRAWEGWQAAWKTKPNPQLTHLKEKLLRLKEYTGRMLSVAQEIKYLENEIRFETILAFTNESIRIIDENTN